MQTATTTYLRFTLLATDADSRRKQGVLVAAHELRDRGELTVDEHSVLREALEWFNKNLHVPKCLGERGNERALSWFKPAAEKPLRHMWALVHLLREHGVQVEVHKTRNPGTILYEDGWQIVAKPKRGKRTAW